MKNSYANLFVGYVEHQCFNQYNGPKPELYGHYIDDCIGAILSSREELDQFITSVNSFHPALKYTWEISETSLAFLDIKVSIRGNVLCTSVHYKPTDSHSYLTASFKILLKNSNSKSRGMFPSRQFFTFVCSVLSTPASFTAKVDKLIFDFIWNYKIPKIKKTTLIKDKENGGLNMINFSLFDKALKYVG